MRRWLSAGLLVTCLGVFLCPAVGKPDAATLLTAASIEEQERPSCEIDTPPCGTMTEPVDRCCNMPTQNSHSSSQGCSTACSALVLMCIVAEKQRWPRFAEQLFFPQDNYATTRADRPPVPPPRA
jgi:hypothetical protein